MTDCADGTYLVSYSAAISGKYSLALMIHGQHIDGSPFRLVVASAEGSPPARSPPARSGSPASPRRLPPQLSPSAQYSPRLHTPRTVASPRVTPVARSPR